MIEIRDNPIPLARPFSYFLETLTALPYAELSLTTPDGLSGRGEIACSVDANGETVASAQALAHSFNSIVGNAMIKDENEIEAIMAECELRIAYNAAAKCGLEQALYEIYAQRAGKPLASILGATKESLRTQCTIPFLEDLDSYEMRMREVLSGNPTFVKLKIGKNLNLEAAALALLRARAPSVSLSVDANQCFRTPEDALAFLSRIEGLSISWIEQPLRAGDGEGWQALRSMTSMPLMADESIHTVEDLRWYLENELIDYVNVKLAKCGGIGAARKILSLLRGTKVKAMLGSMLHGESGMRYNLAFALSEDFVTYDFFSYFSLKDYRLPPLIERSTLTTTEAVRGF